MRASERRKGPKVAREGGNRTVSFFFRFRLLLALVFLHLSFPCIFRASGPPNPSFLFAPARRQHRREVALDRPRASDW